MIGVAYRDGVTGLVVTSPVAGNATTVDLAWGPGAGAAVSTVLTCAGATFDTSYSNINQAHMVALGSLKGYDLGWTPNNIPVFLNPTDAAQGFWRLVFPTAGAYTLSLSGVGIQSVTIVTPPTPPTPPTTSGVYPTVQLLDLRPLGTVSSRTATLSFNGTYPAAGFDFPGFLFGLEVILFADVNDTSTLRFNVSAGKMRVYNSSGEVSGTVTFSTRALIIGSAA